MSEPITYPHRGTLWHTRDQAVAWAWGVAHNRRLAELALPDDHPARVFIEQLGDALDAIGEAFDGRFEQAHEAVPA